jgi:hypothetical protein
MGGINECCHRRFEGSPLTHITHRQADQESDGAQNNVEDGNKWDSDHRRIGDPMHLAAAVEHFAVEFQLQPLSLDLKFLWPMASLLAWWCRLHDGIAFGSQKTKRPPSDGGRLHFPTI